MSTTEALLRYSELDSSRFSVSIFRAELTQPAQVALALEEAERSGADLLFIRCPSSSVEVAQELERRGAELMDTLVLYACLVERALPAAPLRATVRAFQPADLAALAQVARAAFSGFAGHYHADPRLDAGKATEGYVEWFERSTRAAERSVLVAEWQAAPAGFLTLRRATAAAPACIELNAVAPAAQGNGLYDSLVKAALADCRAHQEQVVEVSTQLANVAPQKVWVRNGFEPKAAHYTFHYWPSGNR